MGFVFIRICVINVFMVCNLKRNKKKWSQKGASYVYREAIEPHRAF